MKTHPGSLVLASLLLAATLPLAAQEDSEEKPVFELSPFEVSSSTDKGYYASNAISGSRINVPIQDIPLTIEVVTSEFIEDTGATDLRSSLKYSAGLLLQSQNDAYGAFDNFGAVNNPEAATGDKGESSFKIRGFVLDNTLRNGFRRKHATDTVNIDRIEVVRGPSALLYGVGNFGGIVNYITKAPLPEAQQEVSLSYGSDGFKRAALDLTGPLFTESLGYRVTMAYEDTDDWTDLNTTEHWFVSPVVVWKPFKRVKLTLDLEYGRQDEDGIGFKSVRAPTVEDVPIWESDRLETYGFLEFEGKDVRSFRWSGPDTFLDTESLNGNFSVEIGLLENLYYNGGINYSEVNFLSLDVFGGIAINSAAARAQGKKATIIARQIIDGSSNDVKVPIDNAVFQYNWGGNDETIEWIQHRHELNYNTRIFEGKNWLESEHNFLLGYSMESQDYNRTGSATRDAVDSDNWMYKDPTDSSYIRFDPANDQPFGERDYSGGVSENEGTYLVYSGRFFKERLFLVAGMRKDTTSNLDGYYELIGSRAGRQTFEDSTISKKTYQYGASFEIMEGLSVFALNSEGVEPNFGGKRDGWGKALDATVAEAKEFGIKLNLLDGKIAGTLSKFKIIREGLPFSYWWAPAPIRGQFRRTDDIIYRMDDYNPEIKTTNPFLQSALQEWMTAKTAGAVYPKESVDGRATYTYLNASTPEGGAFLDKVFAALNDNSALPLGDPNKVPGWAGWLFNGLQDDPEVNSAAEDWSSGDFFQSITDQSEGFEAQFIFTPTDRFQFIFNYSHVEREVINPGNLAEYDYAEDNWDRWAVWYYPDGAWGLAGAQPEDAYPGGEAPGLPNRDTSTWSGIGWGKGEALDDTPKDVISIWAHYTFAEDSPITGFELGLGGIWESGREYASAYTSAGQKKINDSGATIRAVTDERLTLNGMVRYGWTTRQGHDAYVQINVDNFLDDTKQYGFFYAPGISWKLNMGMTF